MPRPSRQHTQQLIRCPAKDAEARPEADNLLGIYGALADISREQAVERWAGKNFSEFKAALAELSAEVLGKICGEMRRLMADPGYIDSASQRRRAARMRSRSRISTKCSTS